MTITHFLLTHPTIQQGIIENAVRNHERVLNQSIVWHHYHATREVIAS